MGSLSETSLVEDLAQEILVNSKLLSASLLANRLPQPSFAIDGPVSVLPPTAPQYALDARTAVAEAAFKLFNLVSGPSEVLPNIMASYQTIFALDWLVHFKILTHIPLKGSVPYGSLARAAGVPESLLKAMARMCMTSQLLTEPAPEEVAHSAASAMFVRNPNMMDWAQFMFGASIPTAAAMVEATERWPEGSVKKTETAYNVAFAHDLPFFDHLSKSEELTRQFAGYMKSVTDAQGTDLVHLVGGFDWAGLKQDALVVDVGGSTGHGTYALAAAFPQLRFEVQDLAEVVANGPAALAEQPSDISSRVTFKAHDFFTPQPTKDADVYVLRMILHDWPDSEALSILTNLVPALGAGSTLVIMDTVLPAPGQVPVTKERVIRVRDLTMRQVFNAKERTLRDWEELLRKADERLKIRGVKQPVGSHMSLLSVEF